MVQQHFSEGYQKLAQPGRLSLGIVFPIESYAGSVPTLSDQEKLAQRAEALGFEALWFRDIPLHDPAFGDAGQLFDPWIYMTHMMHQTQRIVLATGSLILPLRHPIHVAKSMASLQELSGGRLVMGIASGDRPVEYPAFAIEHAQRGELFSDHFTYLRKLQEGFPVHQSAHLGTTSGNVDVLPKTPHRTPLLVTGHSGQSVPWIAEHADGWLYYPRNFHFLQHTMGQWREALLDLELDWKPYMQSLYVDLQEDQDASPEPIQLGFRTGREYLIAHLLTLRNFGVNHVILNFKHSRRPVLEAMEELAEHVIPVLNT